MVPLNKAPCSHLLYFSWLFHKAFKLLQCYIGDARDFVTKKPIIRKWGSKNSACFTFLPRKSQHTNIVCEKCAINDNKMKALSTAAGKICLCISIYGPFCQHFVTLNNILLLGEHFSSTCERRENVCIALKWFCGDIWCYIMLESARPWFLFIAICKIRCNLHISKGFDVLVQQTSCRYLIKNSTVSSSHITKYKIHWSCTIPNTFIFFHRTLLSTLMKNAFRFQSRWQEMT